jgi:hypothetical protein
MLPRDLNGVGNGLKEHAWPHDALDAAAADSMCDVKQPMPVFDDRRLLNEKNALRQHDATPHQAIRQRDIASHSERLINSLTAFQIDRTIPVFERIIALRNAQSL